MQLPVYLDNNATTKCDERVVEVMLPYFTEKFGNAASRSHVYGWLAEEAVDGAREKVATIINASPKEIVFTSGATEADNLALKGVYENYASKGNHIITCVTEHKAVLDTCKHLERLGASVTYLPVNNDGRIELNELKSAITTSTILIAIMYANNETGVIQPIKEIGKIAKEHNIIFFCDAAQAVGKIAVNVLEDDIDILAFSAHKMYGPKGIGALYVRRKNPRVKLIAQMDGGGHENGMRSGTLNVPAIVGFGKACELCMSSMLTEMERLQTLRNKFEKNILESGDVIINGSTNFRLPHVTNLSFENISADKLMMSMSQTVAVSSGSACTSNVVEPSYVLRAMQLSHQLASSSLRFALGRFTTEEEIDFVIKEIKSQAKKMRQANTSYS